MFGFFKKENNKKSMELNESHCYKEQILNIILDEIANSDAALLFLKSKADGPIVFGVQLTDDSMVRIFNDPLSNISLEGRPDVTSIYFLLHVHRLIKFLTIYLSGRYAWSILPPSMHQEHPNYLSNAGILKKNIDASLALYTKLQSKHSDNSEITRLSVTIIDSILYASSALDDNNFEIAESELTNASTQFYRLLTIKFGNINKFEILIMCAIGIAFYLINSRALNLCDDDEYVEMLKERCDDGLKFHNYYHSLVNQDFFYKRVD